MSDESRDRGTHDRMTVAEAALILGISKSAVRKRVERGKLEHERAPDGRLLIYLDKTATERDMSRASPRQSHEGIPDERYIRSLEEQVGYLRGESERKDAIIMSLSQANAEMSRTIRAIEAPSEAATTQAPSEPPGAPTEATEQPGRVESQAPLEAAQEGALRPDSEASEAPRPWWRRVFG